MADLSFKDYKQDGDVSNTSITVRFVEGTSLIGRELPHPGLMEAKLLIVMTAVVYVLPFVLTVSAPRCVALDFVLWMDLGAMVVTRFHTSRAANTSEFVTAVT